jgi:GNAT superfamily N-acetyltransferase
VTPIWRIEALDPRHDRASFDSGAPPLDRYLRELATQDVRRLVTKCFVACPVESITVAGFYTLAAAELPLTALPQTLTRRLPRYPSVPVVRLGRLAVDLHYRGKGLGGIMVANAFGKVIRSDIGAFAMLVDAKDDAAAAFYRHFGFLPAGTGDRALFLPVATGRALFETKL